MSELIVTPNLLIRKGFRRYKNVIRNPATEERIGFLEGNARWYDLFSGETFYTDSKNIWCEFTNQNNKKEKLYLLSIDLSEYELLHLSMDLIVIQHYGQKGRNGTGREAKKKKIA